MTSDIVSDSNFNNKINEINAKEGSQINTADLTKNNNLSDVIISDINDFNQLAQVGDNGNIRTIKNKNLIIDYNASDIFLS